MKKVFVAGGVSYDRIIYIDKLPEGKSGSIFSSSSHDCVGGTGAGKSLNLCKLGFETIFHAFVGNDEAGDKIKEYFKNKKLKFIPQIDSDGSLRFTNLIDKNGDRISIFTSYNTFNPEIDLKELKSIIEKSDFIVLNIMNYTKKLIPIAKELKKEIWCDIHDYDGENEYHKEFIDGADYIFMSSEQLKNYKQFMEKMIKSGKKLVVCTHGKSGATALTSEGKWIEEEILDKFKKVDTNGAGDAFFTGFLYGHSKGKSIKECMRYGTITAGMCITSKELYSEELSCERLEREYNENYGIKIFEEKSIKIGDEEFVLKEIEKDDEDSLGRYFEGLSEETRRGFGPHPLNKSEAEKICREGLAESDVRVILKSRVSGETAAYFILLFDTIVHEDRRYKEHGVELDGRTDVTFAPSVADSYQDKKAGSTCMPYILEFLKENGKRYFVLMGGTQSTNGRAVRFYEKFGFKRVGSYMTDIENYDMYMEI
jgi:acarbose 7IV-phosphotransferase